MQLDIKALGAELAAVVKAQMTPLLSRIKALEEEGAALKAKLADMPGPVNGKDGERGADGRDGKDCDMEAVKSMIADAVKNIPVVHGKDGADGKNGLDGKNGTDGTNGRDGTSVTVKDIEDMVKDEVHHWTEGIPVPKDGKSITLEDVRPVLDAAVKAMREDALKTVDAAVKAIPVPKDGRDGKDGKDGDTGQKGADGVGAAGAMIDRDGSLMLTLTNGEVKNLGPVVGKDGSDGADGKDGASFESFELEYLPESHEIAVKASVAGRAKELRFPAGGIRPAGYWREGTKAKANEAWVHDGSTWFAVRATEAKPESKSADWIIGARKGRDGETVVKTVREGPPPPIKLES